MTMKGTPRFRIVRTDDVRMLELADGLDFLLEPGDSVHVARAAGKNLDGHDSIEFCMEGLVDRAHASLAELLQNLIFAETP